MISDSPLKDWVLWDSGSTVAAYCRKMSQGSVWGGGIEMAAVSHMKCVDVFVYQQSGGGYKRISRHASLRLPTPLACLVHRALTPRLCDRSTSRSFEGPKSTGNRNRAVRVLYGGGVHYDALEVT